jgi:hypothetical protein
LTNTFRFSIPHARPSSPLSDTEVEYRDYQTSTQDELDRRLGYMPINSVSESDTGNVSQQRPEPLVIDHKAHTFELSLCGLESLTEDEVS